MAPDWERVAGPVIVQVVGTFEVTVKVPVVTGTEDTLSWQDFEAEFPPDVTVIVPVVVPTEECVFVTLAPDPL